MRVLLLNMAMDADDPVLGFTTDWVNAIADRVESVSVITMRRGRLDVRDNVTVHSVGKERGWSEVRRFAAFYRELGQIVRRQRPDVCFAHMIPLFSVMLAPVAKPLRLPVLLWYAHGAVPRMLRIGERLADRCVTSTAEGFRLPSEKLRVLHQGIDVDRFRPPAEPPELYERTVVSVGRLSPVKRMLESVDSLADARRRGAELELAIFGGPVHAEDAEYIRQVEERVRALGLEDHVHLHGAVGAREIPDAYHRGGIFLNLSRSGSLDKAILEAMASGCIGLSSNDAFRAMAQRHGWVSLVCDENSAGAALARLAALPAAERAGLRAELRGCVAAEHGLPDLADLLVEQMEGLIESGRHAG